MLAFSDRQALARVALRDVLIALFCALFALIYERFSHGVWSARMVFAFAWPLAGALPFLMSAAANSPWPILRSASALWHAGVAALAVGSLFGGALEIYGTTHPLLIVYPIAGGLLCMAAAVVQAVGRVRFSL